MGLRRGQVSASLTALGRLPFATMTVGSVGAVHNLDEVGETFRFDVPLAFGLAMLNSRSRFPVCCHESRVAHGLPPAKYPRGRTDGALSTWAESARDLV